MGGQDANNDPSLHFDVPARVALQLNTPTQQNSAQRKNIPLPTFRS
jgi:hypothetical protein